MQGLIKSAEGGTRAAFGAWRRLSIDAKVVGGLAVLNWLLLFQKHTVITVAGDEPIWTLFPGVLGALYMAIVGVVAVAYPLRDHRARAAFSPHQRLVHLGALVALFIVLPMFAEMLLRATGKPYTYIHDGALMAEEAAKKLLAGRNPYSADYVDTPLFYWPMVNNPALYHFTYFPLLFLLSIPPMVVLLPTVGWFDVRLLFLPAVLGCIAVAPLLVREAHARLAVAGALALNPQFFPFVIEGRNDAFVLFFVLLTAFFLHRQRPALAGLSLAVAVGTKLHAVVLVPFVFVFLLARSRPRSMREAWRAVAPAAIPFGVVTALVFVPFIAWDANAFYDDIVAYNAGSAAWSYPVSGVGFSMFLHAVGLIPSRAADFPFWLLEIIVAFPVAAVALRRLSREPTVSMLLLGYAVTLLAFLFFGRYFQTNYLGYIVAAATPTFFLHERPKREIALARAPLGEGGAMREAPVPVPSGTAAE